MIVGLRRCRALLLAVFFCCIPVHSQSIFFEFQTHPDSPIAFVNYTPSTFRTGSDRRLDITVTNESGKATAAVVFQQTVAEGSKIFIVTLERISIVVKPRQKKCMTVSVADVWNRIQTAVRSGETIGKPVLSVVTVEFMDGALWNAPLGRSQK